MRSHDVMHDDHHRMRAHKRRRLTHDDDEHRHGKRIVVLPPDVKTPVPAPPPPVVAAPPPPVAAPPPPVAATPPPAAQTPEPIAQPILGPPPPPPPPPAAEPSPAANTPEIIVEPVPTSTRPVANSPSPTIDPVATTRGDTSSAGAANAGAPSGGASSTGAIGSASISSLALPGSSGTVIRPSASTGSSIASLATLSASSAPSARSTLGLDGAEASALANETGSGNKGGAIAGGVIGGIAVLVLFLILGLCLLRRTLRRRRARASELSAINAIWDEKGDRQQTLRRAASDASYLPYNGPATGDMPPSHNSTVSSSPEATEDGPWESIPVEMAVAAAGAKAIGAKSRMGVPSSQDSDSLGADPKASQTGASTTLSGATGAETAKRRSPAPSAHASVMRRRIGESTFEDLREPAKGPTVTFQDGYFRPPITAAQTSSGRETPDTYQLPPLPSSGGPLWQLPPRAAPNATAAAAIAGLHAANGRDSPTLRRGTNGFFKVAQRASQEPSPPPVPHGELFPPTRDSAYKRFIAQVPQDTRPLNVPGAPPMPPSTPQMISPGQAYGGMALSPNSPAPAARGQGHGPQPAHHRPFVASLSAPPVPPLPRTSVLAQQYPDSSSGSRSHRMPGRSLTAAMAGTSDGGTPSTTGVLSLGSDPKPLAPQPWRDTTQTKMSSWAGDRGR